MPETVKSLDIDITSVCNLACPMCWGAPRGDYDGKKDRNMKLDEFDKILTFMRDEFGSSFVMFNGGETLVRKDAIKFIERARELGYDVNLNTNSILLRHHLQVLQHLRSISIPIDGVTPETTLAMRPPNNLQHEFAFRAIEMLNRDYPDIHLKLGTVVSGVNQHEVIPIGQAVRERGLSVDTWKLYQYKSFGYRRNDPKKSELAIPKDRFEHTVGVVEKQFPEWTVANLPNDTEGLYLLVRPDGSFTTEQDADGNPEPHLGNFITDDRQQLIDVISATVDRTGEAAKISKTYGVD